jgi:polyisoprenoid-binding protein YceI
MEGMQTQHDPTATTPRLGRYEIDPVRSRVSFRTRHLFGLGPVRGTFAIQAGTVHVSEPLADSGVYAEIDVASFHTGNPQRDARVRSARFLNAREYPLMTFAALAADLSGDTITGTLTVRDVERPVQLTITGLEVSGAAFTASASARIDRTEFGVTASPGLAGRYLDLQLEIRCTR